MVAWVFAALKIIIIRPRNDPEAVLRLPAILLTRSHPRMPLRIHEFITKATTPALGKSVSASHSLINSYQLTLE